MERARQVGGRVNQKRRTRAAIVAAAAELVRQGKSPTVAEVADAAAVSRATAYRYFPSQEYLLSEAALNSTRGQVDEILAAAGSSPDLEARMDAVVQALQERIVEQEAGFRALLRLSLEQPFGEGAGPEEPQVRRGARRIDWIERALAPLWDDLDERMRQRLVGALSLCMGVEALVVLRDICGYSPEQAIEVSRWTARMILRSATSL